MRFILTGITAEEGLGLSRAAIFLWDDVKRELILRCAIGSLTRDEAMRAWAGIDRSGPLAERLEKLMERVERLDGADLMEFCRPFREAAGDVTISIDGSAVARAFADRRTSTVGADVDDHWRRRIKDDIRQPFVCVPIRQVGRDWGVIVADNRFLPHEMSIAPDVLRHLEGFADLCAASLASAEHRLNLSLEAGATRRDLPAIVQHQSRLEAERLQRDLVHQARQPIENAERQLKLAAEEIRESTALALIETARGFVERARKVLHKSLFVAEILSDENRPPLQTFRYIGPREIEESVSSMVRYHKRLNGAVRFKDKYDIVASDERAFGDLQTLELAFWELLTNASKYADKGADIIVGVSSASHTMVFEISNKGIPLSAQDAVDCKERGWRSREARSRPGHGSGLGLYLVDRIAAAHNGTLTIEPTNGEGVTRFILGIPLSGEARATNRHSG
jgi:signal transduction histidine kinase